MEKTEPWLSWLRLTQRSESGLKRCFCSSQESCCFNKRKMPGSVAEAIGLDADLVEDAAVTLPGVVKFANLRIDKLSGQLATSKAEVIC